MTYNPQRTPAGDPRDPRLDGCHPDYSPLHLEESPKDWPKWPDSIVKYQLRGSFKRDIGKVVTRVVVTLSAISTFASAAPAIVSELVKGDTKNTSALE